MLNQATNYAKNNTEIKGTFSVPTNSLSLLIKTDSSVYQKPTISLTYSQKDSPLITVKAYGNDATPADGYMELTFGSDITATIKKTDTSFDLKKNSATIATYKKSDGRVTYLDGTFEQY